MQLATKISELAGDRQDEERQREEQQKNGEYKRLKGHKEEGESQDMFYPTQDDNIYIETDDATPTNPFLAAKYRKENSWSTNSGTFSADKFTSPSNEARNPFKKSNLTPQRLA